MNSQYLWFILQGEPKREGHTRGHYASLPSPTVTLHKSCQTTWLFSKLTMNFQITQSLWGLFLLIQNVLPPLPSSPLSAGVKSNSPFSTPEVWIKAFSLLPSHGTLSISFFEHLAYLPCIIIRSIYAHHLQKKVCLLKDCTQTYLSINHVPHTASWTWQAPNKCFMWS